MQTSTEIEWRRQGWNASKISNAGPRMDTFLTIKEGDLSQRGIKRKLVLWRLDCIPGRSQMCLRCFGYTKVTRSYSVRCGGKAAIKGLCNDLKVYH